jgi:NDP-sugar pyrophosphorylase family protein
MGLAIVVLAAGLGTRYGATKQLAPLGPSGEALLDYTLHDAEKAGVSDAVIVVAPEIVEPMRAHLRDFAPPVRVRLVVQDATAPRGAPPLGTAHATVVGATGLTTPFAVANADDLYGREAMAAMGSHLASLAGDTRARGAVVGYPAHATLSPLGGVSRAVCRVDEHGRLIEVEEHTGVRRHGDDLVSDTATLDDSTLVSMNLWGFDPSFVDLLRPLVDRFVARRADAEHGELRLPDVVGELVARGELDVTVLSATSTWLGVTHSRDAPHVRARLAELTAAGVYPSRASGNPTAR